MSFFAASSRVHTPSSQGQILLIYLSVLFFFFLSHKTAAKTVVVEPGSDEYKAYNTYNEAIRAPASEAVLLLKKTIKLKPDFLEAINNLGIQLSVLKRIDEALITWNRGLLMANQSKKMKAIFHNNLGFLQSNNFSDYQHQRQALNHFEAAITLSPTYYDAQTNRALSLFKLGRFRQALEQFKAINLTMYKFTQPGINNKISTSLLTLGATYYKLNKKSKSSRVFSTLIFRTNDDASRLKATINLAKIQVGMSNLSSACKLTQWILGNTGVTSFLQDTLPKSLLQKLFVQAVALRIKIHRKACFWKHRSSAEDTLKKFIEKKLFIGEINGDSFALEPFESIMLQSMNARHRKFIAERYEQSFVNNEGESTDIFYSKSSSTNGSIPNSQKYGGKVVRIAYFSADFRQHVMCYLARSLFKSHRLRYDESATTSKFYPLISIVLKHRFKYNYEIHFICPLDYLQNQQKDLPQ